MTSTTSIRRRLMKFQSWVFCLSYLSCSLTCVDNKFNIMIILMIQLPPVAVDKRERTWRSKSRNRREKTRRSKEAEQEVEDSTEEEANKEVGFIGIEGWGSYPFATLCSI